ncbi:MAG: hypothetical protein P4L99_20390 [Chthoniobacter sp.]|nr:hypothetical protein [Chthoniobacter sp.]
MNSQPEYSTTRTGKIARLPQAIRHQLNQHLADGELSRRKRHSKTPMKPTTNPE